jgi:serine/threonine protein kinase
MAPEMVRKEGYSMKIDVWAIGILTYALLCGYTPFDADTDEETMV